MNVSNVFIVHLQFTVSKAYSGSQKISVAGIFLERVWFIMSKTVLVASPVYLPSHMHIGTVDN